MVQEKERKGAVSFSSAENLLHTAHNSRLMSSPNNETLCMYSLVTMCFDLTLHRLVYSYHCCAIPLFLAHSSSMAPCKRYTAWQLKPIQQMCVLELRHTLGFRWAAEQNTQTMWLLRECVSHSHAKSLIHPKTSYMNFRIGLPVYPCLTLGCVCAGDSLEIKRLFVSCLVLLLLCINVFNYFSIRIFLCQ